MTLKELRKLSRKGKKKTIHGLWFEPITINVTKKEITAQLPLEERKKLFDEEWDEWAKSKRKFWCDKLYLRLREEYNIPRESEM